MRLVYLSTKSISDSRMRIAGDSPQKGIKRIVDVIRVGECDGQVKVYFGVVCDGAPVGYGGGDVV